jgi:hypothetical protein
MHTQADHSHSTPHKSDFFFKWTQRHDSDCETHLKYTPHLDSDCETHLKYTPRHDSDMKPPAEVHRSSSSANANINTNRSALSSLLLDKTFANPSPNHKTTFLPENEDNYIIFDPPPPGGASTRVVTFGGEVFTVSSGTAGQNTSPMKPAIRHNYSNSDSDKAYPGGTFSDAPPDFFGFFSALNVGNSMNALFAGDGQASPAKTMHALVEDGAEPSPNDSGTKNQPSIANNGGNGNDGVAGSTPSKDMNGLQYQNYLEQNPLTIYFDEKLPDYPVVTPPSSKNNNNATDSAITPSNMAAEKGPPQGVREGNSCFLQRMYAYVCMYVCMHVCVCMCVCFHVHAHKIIAYTFIHTQTHKIMQYTYTPHSHTQSQTQTATSTPQVTTASGIQPSNKTPPQDTQTPAKTPVDSNSNTSASSSSSGVQAAGGKSGSSSTTQHGNDALVTSSAGRAREEQELNISSSMEDLQSFSKKPWLLPRNLKDFLAEPSSSRGDGRTDTGMPSSHEAKPDQARTQNQDKDDFFKMGMWSSTYSAVGQFLQPKADDQGSSPLNAQADNRNSVHPTSSSLAPTSLFPHPEENYDSGSDNVDGAKSRGCVGDKERDNGRKPTSAPGVLDKLDKSRHSKGIFKMPKKGGAHQGGGGGKLVLTPRTAGTHQGGGGGKLVLTPRTAGKEKLILTPRTAGMQNRSLNKNNNTNNKEDYNIMNMWSWPVYTAMADSFSSMALGPGQPGSSNSNTVAKCEPNKDCDAFASQTCCQVPDAPGRMMAERGKLDKSNNKFTQNYSGTHQYSSSLNGSYNNPNVTAAGSSNNRDRPSSTKDAKNVKDGKGESPSKGTKHDISGVDDSFGGFIFSSCANTDAVLTERAHVPDHSSSKNKHADRDKDVSKSNMDSSKHSKDRDKDKSNDKERKNSSSSNGKPSPPRAVDRTQNDDNDDIFGSYIFSSCQDNSSVLTDRSFAPKIQNDANKSGQSDDINMMFRFGARDNNNNNNNNNKMGTTATSRNVALTQTQTQTQTQNRARTYEDDDDTLIAAISTSTFGCDRARPRTMKPIPPMMQPASATYDNRSSPVTSKPTTFALFPPSTNNYSSPTQHAEPKFKAVHMNPGRQSPQRRASSPSGFPADMPPSPQRQPSPGGRRSSSPTAAPANVPHMRTVTPIAMNEKSGMWMGGNGNHDSYTKNKPSEAQGRFKGAAPMGSMLSHANATGQNQGNGDLQAGLYARYDRKVPRGIPPGDDVRDDDSMHSMSAWMSQDLRMVPLPVAGVYACVCVCVCVCEYVCMHVYLCLRGCPRICVWCLCPWLVRMRVYAYVHVCMCVM